VETYLRVYLPHHPLLGRNVNHDPLSRGFPVQPTTTTLTAVRHEAHIGILNQGNIGSCTANAGLSCAYHEPFYRLDMPQWSYEPVEDGALRWYARNTAEDDYAGTFTYPPPGGQDTGSDGLTTAKVAVEAGIASGYLHAFSAESALYALVDRPWIMGINWYNSMFPVGSNGLLDVNLGSGLAGGHELCADELVPPDDTRNGTGDWLLGGPQSWDVDWGDHGRWYMRRTNFTTLMSLDGDVTQFVPAADPAPTPTPGPEVDEHAEGDRLWTPRLRRWARASHTGENRWAAGRVEDWAQRTGRA
jgi:hypothetical protein